MTQYVLGCLKSEVKKKYGLKKRRAHAKIRPPHLIKKMRTRLHKTNFICIISVRHSCGIAHIYENNFVFIVNWEVH